MTEAIRSVTGVTWTNHKPPRPLRAVFADGEAVMIETRFEDPAVLRSVAALIDAGPPPDPEEVSALVMAMRGSGRWEECPEGTLVAAAKALWEQGVRAL